MTAFPTAKRPLPLLAAVLLASGLHAQEQPDPAAMVDGMPATPPPAATFVPGRMINLRPDEKRPLALKDGERNPYAKRGPETEISPDENGNTEELRIRERLTQLRVTGRSNGPKGLRVLLGDIILEQGAVLPPLFEDQSENLRVIELNDDTVVLGWLDIETNELTGKTMQVAYDLSPSVVYALHGQETPKADAGGATAARKMGVMRVAHDRKRQETGMAARDPSEGIPAGQ